MLQFLHTYSRLRRKSGSEVRSGLKNERERKGDINLYFNRMKNFLLLLYMCDSTLYPMLFIY